MMADPERVAQARRLLAQPGVTVADLQAAESVGVEMPTVAEYLPRVVATAGSGAGRTTATTGRGWRRCGAIAANAPIQVYLCWRSNHRCANQPLPALPR